MKKKLILYNKVISSSEIYSAKTNFFHISCDKIVIFTNSYNS